MSSEPTLVSPVPGPSDTISLDHFTDRRADIDYKVNQIPEIIEAHECEGLLLLDPANFTWLTSGATIRGILNPEEQPTAYSNGEQRWVFCSNVDTQRIFDEEVNQLGFQVKEWPWHWGRQEMLEVLAQNRQIASDLPFLDAKQIGEEIQRRRMILTPYEEACIQTVGSQVSHAIEATCRTMTPGLNEREIAGHVCHRLVHRGVQMLQVSVAVDGRSRVYRQHGYTPTKMERYAVIRATGRKYGIVATASRTVCFGKAESDLRKAHDAACKVSATYLASTWPDAVPRDILATGMQIYRYSGYEHEWMLCPQGHLTGRKPVERMLFPTTDELLQHNQAITWQASVGPAIVCDTFLITDQGPRTLTPTETWPQKRIRVQGADFSRPDILERE